MKEEQVVVGDKTYNVKEVKYKDVAALGEIDKSEAAKQMMVLSTGMTEEEYNELSMSDGIKLTNAINKLNGIDKLDFRQLPIAKE